ncbi:MAG: glycosyltransferase, partial [Metallosphaera prunae]
MVFISVIITAHNRKEYLMQAVDSALNQTLPKTEYEVIVVKNFEDYDEELEKKGVKSIVTSEKELGEKIVIGTKEA